MAGARDPGIAEPLLAALRQNAPLPLHLPSHGRGAALAPELRRLLRQRPGSWDLPELPAFGGPLESEGAVAEAQRRAAKALGADACWFGVNGASGLLQAALLGLCPPGSRVLLPRNLHRSLLHACVLGDLEPVLYALPFDAASGHWLPPPPAHLQQVLKEALRQGPIAALVLVDPTYQGRGADLAALVALAHGNTGAPGGLPVLVDQAHGDGSALAAGADLVVLSLQKAASGLAQSAVLLAQGPRIDRQALERSLLWLQTSSPSALLLASCATALDEGLSAAGQRRRRRAERRGLELRQRLEALDLPIVVNDDPLRLVLATAPMGINGLEADAWLLERGVIAELPEPGSLTFCLGLQPPPGLERRLGRQLLDLRGALGGNPLPPFAPPPLPLVASLDLPLGAAWRAHAVERPLREATGAIAARPLVPYPPGIPLLIPGERLDGDRTHWLLDQQNQWPGQIADTLWVVAPV
ncbi:MAG: lysine decarboxylase [Cyanobacteria bacterium]|nr:lysine decarboxylase [Cyanobacteriota bacterium]